jgi:hypothetical protein
MDLAAGTLFPITKRYELQFGASKPLKIMGDK